MKINQFFTDGIKKNLSQCIRCCPSFTDLIDMVEYFRTLSQSDRWSIAAEQWIKAKRFFNSSTPSPKEPFEAPWPWQHHAVVENQLLWGWPLLPRRMPLLPQWLMATPTSSSQVLVRKTWKRWLNLSSKASKRWSIRNTPILTSWNLPLRITINQLCHWTSTGTTGKRFSIFRRTTATSWDKRNWWWLMRLLQFPCHWSNNSSALT